MADFGVARFQNNGGVMTAETGTYRWMAPEVDRLSNFQFFRCSDVYSLYRIWGTKIFLLVVVILGSAKKYVANLHVNYSFIQVINHQPYDQKADVFSFAIVLWELVTAKVMLIFLD